MKMLRITALLIALVATLSSSARAEELQICTTDRSPSAIVREHADARISSIFLQVLKKTGMRASEFGICEHDRLSTLVAGIEKTNGKFMIGVLVSSRVRSLPDGEVEGLFAHELAHVAIGIDKPHTVATEIAADAKAIEWVGAEKVLMMLKGNQRDLSLLPRVWTPGVRRELEQRIQAIERNRA